MKKLITTLIMIILITSCEKKDYSDISAEMYPLTTAISESAPEMLTETGKEVRGAWIASVYNINFPSKADLPESKLKEELDSIVEKACSLNLNTLFFQVHPCDDALYKSDLFPVSKYISNDGNLYFDPLDYIITKCHENDIALHAWINPLRVTVTKYDSFESAISSLDNTKGAGKTPELLVYYADGKLYYNAGLPEVRELISDCVAEILSRYDVDGIVFDDYFYPSPISGIEFNR